MTERAGNVVEALARVAADLPGIGKDSKAAPDQGGYAYRGIEAITRAVQPLLAREGVVFVPSVQSWERDVVLVGRDRKEWHDDRMLILYRVYGPGGRDDVIEVGPIPAIGRDGTDKGANKCMTQAFKYALLQALCVADSKDDGDQEHHEAERAPELITAGQARDLIERLNKLGGYPDRWKQASLPSIKNMAYMTVGDYVIADEILEAAELERIVGASEASDRPADGATGSPDVSVVDEPASDSGSAGSEESPGAPSPASSTTDLSDDLGRPF